jgi:signal transduction histidine kinase
MNNIEKTPDAHGLLEERLLKKIVVHLLGNFATSHSRSVSALLDAMAVGKLTASEEIQDLMLSMKRTSEQMRKFLNAIMNVTRGDDRCPSELLEAATQAGALFEVSLLKLGIDLQIEVEKDMMLNVPFSVATLAIANLIDNSKDAMGKHGEIRIKAGTDADMVLCRVIDQGCGISQELGDRIFDFGVTTKAKDKEWAGQGLPLTRALLQKNNSSIELTETSDKGSTFTIHFPRPQQEVL